MSLSRPRLRRKSKLSKRHELRATFAVGDPEIVATPDLVTLRGIAAVTNVETVRWDMFRLVIRPGAFTKTLAESNVRALWNHNDDFPLASTKSGTLFLQETARGLEFEMQVNPVGMNAGFIDAIQRRIVEGMSFGFDVVKESWHETEGQMPLLEIHELRMHEVSPCTFPQYEDNTSVEALDAAKRVLSRLQPGGATTPRLEPEATATEPQSLHSDGERRKKHALAAVVIAKHRGAQHAG
jgi:HK97 family phage prohead protease